MNYLRPDIKRGNITPDEDDLIIRMHSLLGNRWSLIAGRLPGRTDNEIKNYWNTHLSKRLIKQGTDPNTHKSLSDRLVQETKGRSNRKNKINRSKAKIKKAKKPNRDHVEEPKKPKVHLPKPFRVSSFSMVRNYSFERNNNDIITTCESSSQEKGEDHVDDDVPWLSSVKEGIDHHDLVNDTDDQDQGHDHDDSLFNGTSTTTLDHDGTLEKLYDEYLQLLKTEEDDRHDQVELDSFAESLLI